MKGSVAHSWWPPRGKINELHRNLASWRRAEEAYSLLIPKLATRLDARAQNYDRVRHFALVTTDESFTSPPGSVDPTFDTKRPSEVRIHGMLVATSDRPHRSKEYQTPGEMLQNGMHGDLNRQSWKGGGKCFELKNWQVLKCDSNRHALQATSLCPCLCVSQEQIKQHVTRLPTACLKPFQHQI